MNKMSKRRLEEIKAAVARIRARQIENKPFVDACRKATAERNLTGRKSVSIMSADTEQCPNPNCNYFVNENCTHNGPCQNSGGGEDVEAKSKESPAEAAPPVVPEEGTKGEKLSQPPGDANFATPPAGWEDKYKKVPPANYSADEIDAMKQLHSDTWKDPNNPVEHLSVSIEGEMSKPLTNNSRGEVVIPDELEQLYKDPATPENSIRLYHTHTNGTTFEPVNDLSKLQYKAIDSVSLMEYDKFAYSVSRGSGKLPTEAEYEAAKERAWSKFRGDLRKIPGYAEWKDNELAYVTSHEVARNTINEFGWTIKGERLL